VFFCSMGDADVSGTEFQTVLSRLLDSAVTAVELLGGGRNSQVYRLTCAGLRQYLAKIYFRHEEDQRDRLEVELSSLQFLWRNGVTCVPQPIAVDRELACVVYEFIEGRRIPSAEVTESDIDDAVQFLVRLEGLKRQEGSRQLALASEVCFSIAAIVDNIHQRMDRLFACRDEGTIYRALGRFLRSDFLPAFGEIVRWCQSQLDKSGVDFTTELEFEERTLSPSDFGFHNALRRTDNRIVYLDFEYFGWDDPAKMVSDFLLHPAMELDDVLKRRFAENIVGRWQNARRLARRIEIVYPLFGLKWCLILLNEFVPEHLLRRGFASGGDLRRCELQEEQLRKAKRMLERVRREYGKFSYWN